MKKLKILFLFILSGVISFFAHSEQNSLDNVDALKKDQFISLNFHDVRNDVEKYGDRDPYAIDTKNLVAFFDWLSTSKWNPISLKQIVEARQQKKALPPNAILLTFDDGTLSNYTHVFPLLKQYKTPAVFAIVTSWIDKRNKSGEIAYGDNQLLSWEQMREMQASGVVEFASHSDNLHEGVLSNPQGNQQPAATTRQYFMSKNSYESDAEYKDRILLDLKTSKKRFEEELGIQINTIIWPYGSVTSQSEKIAEEAGLPLSFSLGKSIINETWVGTFNRLLVTNNATSEDLKQELTNLVDYSKIQLVEPEHGISVGFDDISAPSDAESNNKLGVLLNEIQALSVGRLFIDVIKETDEGIISFFPNNTFKVKQDLLNRLVWQSRTRLFVNTFAHIPMDLFTSSEKYLTPFVIDMMKNNSNISGLDFDIKEELSRISMMSEIDIKNNPTLQYIENMKYILRSYSNFSLDPQIILHGKITKTTLPHLVNALPYLTNKFSYIHLDIDFPESKHQMTSYIDLFNKIPQIQKDKLMVSLNINHIKNTKQWKSAQMFLVDIQGAGIQNINIHDFTLNKSFQIHKYLYTPLSQNNSPLNYKNSFMSGVNQ